MTVLIESVKDTFYEVLRDRIAAGNPARTIVVRGTVRPGVIVAENELAGAALDGIALVEAFCLRWTSLRVDTQGAVPLTTAGCEIRYSSDGSAGMAGLDRGRSLAAMDAELSVALSSPGFLSAQETYSETTAAPSAATANGSNVFWGAPVFGAAVMRGERMERTVVLEVFGYGS